MAKTGFLMTGLTFMCTTCAGHIVSIWMIAWMFSWKTLPRLILLQGAQVFFITNLLLLEARRHLYRQKFYRCSEIGSMPRIAHIQIYHSISEHLISARLVGGLCMLPLHDVALDTSNVHDIVRTIVIRLCRIWLLHYKNSFLRLQTTANGTKYL